MVLRWPVERVAFWTLMAALLAGHVAAVFTENINWDEFALFARATDTARTGTLHAGGRPGLGVLLLMPLAQACTDAVSTIRSARLLWTGFTLAYVLGFWVLLRQMLRGTTHAWHSAALGVGLLVLVPVFLRWSIQVRTDQPALALGLWGGVALLASRDRPVRAALAGLLFGGGFLFTQKLVYVGALVGVLAIGHTLAQGRLWWGREVLRAALCLTSAGAVIAAYYLVVSGSLASTTLLPLESGLRVLGFYRGVPGAVYGGMLPTLIPHLALIGLTIAFAIVVQVRDRMAIGRAFVLPLVVLNVGALVAMFHTGAFPYFWMTIGLFPATAIALSLGPITEVLSSARLRRLLLGAVWIALALVGGRAALAILRDTQRIQRESLAFIERNFQPTDQGFHPERALFCRHEPDPFPTYFSQTIAARFAGPDREANLTAFLDAFRSRPVAFVVESYRLDQFPREVRNLLAGSYVPYRSAVLIPGHIIRGQVGTTWSLETIVPGNYRWIEDRAGSEASLQVDDQVLSPGDTVFLDRGVHEAVVLTGRASGSLVLSVQDPPAPNRAPFYSPGVRREFDPRMGR